MNDYNIIICSACQQPNPKLFTQCKNCNKALTADDKKIYDSSFNSIGLPKTKAAAADLKGLYGWGVILIVILVVAYIIYTNTDRKKNKVYVSPSFISEIKTNQNVVNADVTHLGFLYIAVVNDGADKSPMAAFYCRLAKDRGENIKAVKVIDAATAEFQPDVVVGKELASSFCK